MGTTIHFVHHRPGAPGLRLGLGPGLCPQGAVEQLRQLFENNSFWGAGRSTSGLRRMLRGSEAVVSAWQQGRLVGFGRATSDGRYRAVLWDVVVARDLEGQGLGRRLVEALLKAAPVADAERVYLMTTNSAGFYGRLGFQEVDSQRLMLLPSTGRASGGEAHPSRATTVENTSADVSKRKQSESG